MSKLALLGGEPVRTRPWPKWPQPNPGDAERLLEVLNSGNWGGYPFPNTCAAAFAARFAAVHGATYGCAVANGTVAITLALIAAGVRSGDEVIVPAYTWDGTAVAVLHAGAVPVFADIGPDTYCIDPDSIVRVLSARTRAIVPVHLAMRFADMDAILAISREYDLTVIEDCAHAHGGAYKGRGAGSMGDAGAFSLQSSKLMTSGEGGVIITSRADLADLIHSLVNCGRAASLEAPRMTGGNFRMSELQAALLISQLDRLPEQNAHRAQNAALLRSELPEYTLSVQTAATREAIYQFILRYCPPRPGVSRDMFVAALEAEGVPCEGRFYEPVYRSDLYRPTADVFPQLAGYRANPCPAAERAAYDESIWIPHFVLLAPAEQMADVVRAVRKVYEHFDELFNADPKLYRLKRMSRAVRPRLEVTKNY